MSGIVEYAKALTIIGEADKVMAERDRYRKALEEIAVDGCVFVSHQDDLPAGCANCVEAEYDPCYACIARTALESKGEK